MPITGYRSPEKNLAGQSSSDIASRVKNAPEKPVRYIARGLLYKAEQERFPGRNHFSAVIVYPEHCKHLVFWR